MRQHFLEPPGYRLDANALLIETAGRTVLVDAGWGAFAPEVGRLPANLRAAGIDLASVDMVVLMHIHPNHVGGLRDAEGAPIYPNAEVVVAEAELAQWRRGPDFGAMAVDEGFWPVFAAAAEGVLALGDRLRPVGPARGVRPRPGAGPGPRSHARALGAPLTSGGASLLCAADAFHDPAFDVAHPLLAHRLRLGPRAGRGLAPRAPRGGRGRAGPRLRLPHAVPGPGPHRARGRGATPGRRRGLGWMDRMRCSAAVDGLDRTAPRSVGDAVWWRWCVERLCTGSGFSGLDAGASPLDRSRDDEDVHTRSGHAPATTGEALAFTPCGGPEHP